MAARFFMGLALAVGLGAAVPPQPLLDEAFQKMYSSDFVGAHRTIDRYIADSAHDPLGYAVRGSAYLFSELDRLGLLESEFFESDKKISDSRAKLKPDARVRDEFYQAVNKSQMLAQERLDKNPNDAEALFARCMSLGELVDYMALVEKKQLASLSVNKRAYRDAKRLLAVDPTFIDAHLTTGFTEYLMGNLPVLVRWFVKFDDVQGSKEEGFRNLEMVARHGHYLKPLAKILLATGYLREKRPRDAQKLLADLTKEFPSNALLKREYEKISNRIREGS